MPRSEAGLFLPTLDVASKEELFAALVGALADEGVALHRDALLRLLVEREAVGTTGLGGGVAIPHACAHVVARTALVFARLRRGLDYGAEDGVAVRAAVLVVAPHGKSGALYAPLLAAVVDAAHDEAGRRRLLGVETFEDFETLMEKQIQPRLREVLAR